VRRGGRGRSTRAGARARPRAPGAVRRRRARHGGLPRLGGDVPRGSGRAVAGDPGAHAGAGARLGERDGGVKHDPIIYYVGAREVRRVKIGTTTNLRARMSQLRAQSIDRLELLASEPGGYADERLRHELFAHVRRHGEWFEWTEEIDDWIST